MGEGWEDRWDGVWEGMGRVPEGFGSHGTIRPFLPLLLYSAGSFYKSLFLLCDCFKRMHQGHLLEHSTECCTSRRVGRGLGGWEEVDNEFLYNTNARLGCHAWEVALLRYKGVF